MYKYFCGYPEQEKMWMLQILKCSTWLTAVASVAATEKGLVVFVANTYEGWWMER